jgi:general stress protein 26
MVNEMIDREKLQNEISELLLTQKLAVLSTQAPGGAPYASLIAYAVTDDLRKIVLATPKATRKFANIKNNPNVALLIDDRSNREQDFHDAKAITVIGRVESFDINAAENDLAALYLQKHPYLEDFLRSPSTSMIQVSVYRYYMVSRFQEVMELHIRDEHNIPAI